MLYVIIIINRAEGMWNAVEKKFPDYFCNFELPVEFDDDEFIVYRACRTCNVDKESFLNSYEEAGCAVSERHKNNPSSYSMSVYSEPKDVLRFTEADRRFHQSSNEKFPRPWKAAQGMTNCECGPHKRSLSCIGRDGRPKKTSHVDWWLYENAEPWLNFTIIDDLKDYIKRHKKEAR